MTTNPFENDLFQEIQPHIVKSFQKYHEKNPKLYEYFKRFSNEAFLSGRSRFGAQMIFERIRWYTQIETTGDIYKVSNNHISCYSRLIMIEDPKFMTFFKCKRSKK